MQQGMLFPAQYAPQVPENWQPSIGNKNQQVILSGRCGKLHAVLWDLDIKHGVVMVFHGNGESVVSVEHEVEQFHQLGYAVMSWDYPGYGLSTDCQFTQADLLADADTAYAWLAKQSGNKSIILYGHSIGTGLALYIAAKHPINGVLLVSPYDSLANVARDHMPFFLPIGFLIRYPMPAEKWISMVNVPVYAIHGLRDTLILPSHAKSLFSHANQNSEIKWLKDAGHNDVTMFEQSDQWIKHKLADIQGFADSSYKAPKK